jgi:hypothetical protein
MWMLVKRHPDLDASSLYVLKIADSARMGSLNNHIPSGVRYQEVHSTSRLPKTIYSLLSLIQFARD